jgi:putative redox protein
MTSKITYLGDLRTEATHLLSGNKIITDAPPDNNGKGEAFSPTDLAATALGACMMTIMGIAARDRGIDMTGATAEVTKKMALDPFRRIAGIDLKITMPSDKKFTEKEKKLLEAAAHACPVSRSLSANLEETVTFIWPN